MSSRRRSSRTAPAIRSQRSAPLLSDISGPKGVTDDELSLAIANNVDGLPGQFETGGAVLAAMLSNDQFGRPDNYYELLGGKFRALTPALADAGVPPGDPSRPLRLCRGRRRRQGEAAARQARPAGGGDAKRASGGDPRHVAHLAAGARFALAVEVEVRAGLGDQLGPALDLVADQIVHRRAGCR